MIAALAFLVLVLVVLGFLGPLALAVALLTLLVAVSLQLRVGGGLVMLIGGAILGVVLFGLDGWLLGPVEAMASVYRTQVMAGVDTEALAVLVGQSVWDQQAWLASAPAGMVAGALGWTAWQAAVPLLYRWRQGRGSAAGAVALSSASQTETSLPGDQALGTLLGADKTSGQSVYLSDADANTHTLVLGTTGSGKTVTVLNLVESAINRALPVVYIDGKGDLALAQQIATYAEGKGRPVYRFAMSGESCVYNPLASGGFSAKKDRIIELREWSEDHYRKLSEGYLQTVFKVLEAAGLQVDLVTLADYLDTQKLLALLRTHKKGLGEAAKTLAGEIRDQQAAEKHVEGLRAEIRNLARSEIGHLFKTGAGGAGEGPAKAKDDEGGDSTAEKPGAAVLELSKAIDEGAVIIFSLPALQFPALADTLGKLVINDLKAVAHAQLVKPQATRRPVYTVFDEFSVFAGEQVLNVINMGRSAGLHAVLATQSVADIGRAAPITPDHFIRQVFSSCNNFLIQRLNAPEDALTVAELIGTKESFAHTTQIDEAGATGWGSVRRTRQFVVHPDKIKQLARGEAVFVNKNRRSVQQIEVRFSHIIKDYQGEK